MSIAYRLNDVKLMFTAMHAWIALPANAIFYNGFNMDYIGEIFFMKTYKIITGYSLALTI